MTARIAFLALAVAVAGCGGSGTFVTVTVDRAAGGPDVASLDLQLDLDGLPASTTLRERGGGPIAFPTSATLDVGKPRGTLTVTVVARDAAGSEIARDTRSTAIASGKTTPLHLTLGASPSDDGEDMALPPDLTTEPDDMATADVDMAMQSTDMASVAPSAPRNVTATRGDTAATVSWLAPTANGGAAISKYTVIAAPGNLTKSTADGNTLSLSFTGLTNGTTYTFTVTATNVGGTSAASSPSGNVVPAGVPLAPTAVTAQVNDIKSLSVSWTAPSGNGAAITGYTITPNIGAAVNSTTSPVTFANLTVGTNYTFTVKATNSVGPGAASAPSTAVAAADVPAAPQNIVATYQPDGKVLITWDPSNANFSPIIDYTIITTIGVGGASTTAATQLTHSGSGLTNGQQYSFQVTPRNGVGGGPAGVSNAITYGAVVAPAAPTNFSVSGNHGAICYSFFASAGATSYKIYHSTSEAKVFGGTPDVVTTANPSFVSVPAGTYFLAVKASNSAGDSAATPVLSATADQPGITTPMCDSQF